MNIYLGGSSYSREWRNSITTAYEPEFISVPSGVEYPFEFLWKNWMRSGQDSVLGKTNYNYVGPFKIGSDVPPAYRPKEYAGVKAFFYSIRFADVAYFYLEDYDGEVRYRDDVLTQLGYAIAQKETKEYYIIVNISEQVGLGAIPTELVDIVVNTYDPLAGFMEGMEELGLLS